MWHVFAIDDEARYAREPTGFKEVLGAVHFFFNGERIPGFFRVFLFGAVFHEEGNCQVAVKNDAALVVFVEGVEDFFVHRFFVHAQFAQGVVKLRTACPVRGNGRDAGEFQRWVNAVCQPFLQFRLHVVAVRAAIPEEFDDFARLDVFDGYGQDAIVHAFAVFHRLCLGSGGKRGGKREDGQGFFQHSKLRVVPKEARIIAARFGAAAGYPNGNTAC